MISKFRKFIEKERLFEEDDKILLACSGGIDSMVLADLLMTNENIFGIAHINHQTRGEQSDKDQAFIEAYCTSNGLAFYTTTAPLEKMAREAKQNFHAYARAYRYEYLNNILMQHNYKFIATAHHSSDTLETFIINLTRGTGLDGLTGIPIKNNQIIRPLMFYSKKEIIKYAEKFKVDYREDASNLSTKYTRNYIRHEVIPKIDKITPGANPNAKLTISRIKKTKNLLDELIDQRKFVSKENSEISIEKKAIKEFKESETLLYYLIKQYGFNYSQAEQIISGISNVGSIYYSTTHLLLIDRTNILIRKIGNTKKIELTIETIGQTLINKDHTFTIKETTHFEISSNKQVEYFDAEKLSFPLILRGWEPGDKFRPIGMGGKQKKVKDLLTDSKTNRLDKNSQLVLTCNNEIIWVIGHRISEDYKCTGESKKYYKMSFI